MTQILEYIMQHYTLFLGGAILILLAIIGYYADKTNFGQGKSNNLEESDNKINDNKLEITDESEIHDQVDNDIVNNDNLNNVEQTKEEITDDIIEEQQNIDLTTGDNNLLEVLKEQDNVELVNDTSLEENLLGEEVNVQPQNVDLSSTTPKNENLSNEVVSEENTVYEKERKINPLLTDEEVNRFNTEFDALLPKKDVIDNDLLSDIEDLDFEKTQKLNLDDIGDLDNIELPKIKQIDKEEQDIWKF